MRTSLPVLNLSEATFECIFGRGCDGICCQNGRPGVYPEEQRIIRKHLKKFLPELRPEARKAIEKQGHLSRRLRDGMPMLRVVGGWCVFFNKGCVLHKVGAAEGDRYRYKPAMCSLFPLGKTLDDEWYVRQWGVQDEKWGLFCLNPEASSLLAKKSLQGEIELARRYDEEAKTKSPSRARSAAE
jgi:Fe-S-cluster containining protein